MGDDTRQVAVRVAALKAVYDKVRDAYNAARAEASDLLVPGDRLRAVLPAGGNIGTVSVVEGRVSAKVTDPEALTKWVALNAPTEIETVERIRESYVGVLLSRCENVDGEAVYHKTGELLPGVRFTVGDSYAKVTQSEAQLEAFTQAWVNGELADITSAIPALNQPEEGP